MTSHVTPFIPAGGQLLTDAVPVYRNSGPIPNRAYRTGAVGIEVEISAFFIMGQLFARAQVPVISRAMTNTQCTAFPPQLVDAAVCAALVLLGNAPASAQAKLATVARQAGRSTRLPAPTRNTVNAAVARLETLRDALTQRGFLTPFYGVVRANEHDHVHEPFRFPWLAGHADNQNLTLAWGLVAIACASPPILLFSRQPTLACFRGFSQLTLRWLGAHTPTDPATRATA